MYPIKFNKILKEKIWGGRKFQELLQVDLPGTQNFGESWEVSSHKNGISVIANGEYSGKSLAELVDEKGVEILGDEIVKKYTNKFPLLIKYLDINDKLSVQVHPDDDYAIRVEGEFGKFESWFIMDASEDAKLILGMADGVTKEEFEIKVKDRDFKNLFREVSVKKGDFIDVHPGMVHASLTGSIVICEVQQNSDTTYRIFDFDRVENGQKRELHLEKSMDVIDFNMVPNITTENNRAKIVIDSGFIENLTSNDYYNIEKVKLYNGIYSPDIYKNFKIISVIGGNGVIKYGKELVKASLGDTFLIPAKLSINIEGNIEFLNSYI